MRASRLLTILTLSALATLACSGTGSDEDFTETAASGSGNFAVSPDMAPAPAVRSRQGAPSGASEESPVVPPADAAPPSATAQPTTGSVTPPSMLIRTGNASIEVESLDPAIARVRQLAAGLGGYIANTSMQGGKDAVRAATLEVKLPAARFDEAVTGLEPIGDVEAVNVNAQDVGEEFVDIGARVANARRLETRLVELLATRTGRLEDVLAVERELARVRGEIERHEGRLRYLQSRVAVSTLHVSLHEPHPLLGARDNPIAEAVRDSWRNFVGFIAWLIAATGVIVPVAIMAYAAYRLWRHLRARRAA